VSASATPRPARGQIVVDLDLPPGTMVDQFEVIRELGRGGMGTVFLARDTKLARRVALKFLSFTGGDLAQRFVVEARATASCSHENIVVIYQVDEWRGAPYMALEYLEGISFEDTLQKQAPALPRIIEVMTAVTRALVRAHGLGLVHCDLKPANILLTRDGSIKVLDFGIARMMKSTSNDRRLADIHRELSQGLQLTVDDTGVSGTLPYMSFEQWGVGEIDHRTDIWAMGIIFWEALTGQHPMGEVSIETIMESVASMETPLPSIASVAPQLPAALVTIIDRCLVKEREGRFADSRELLAALEQLSFGRRDDSRSDNESPFLGMAAFQESDAEMFFGRDREVAEAVTRLADNPMLVLAGPSGIGKSSMVRAGIVPALKAAGAWKVGIARPGRRPIEELVAASLGLVKTDTRIRTDVPSNDVAVERSRQEPGFLGALLRSYARKSERKVLLFIDQFEETFTIADPAERASYLACLLGIADDASSPLRLVISIRSDFLDRMGEDPTMRERMSTTLMFMQPLGVNGLRDALERPVALVGYNYQGDIVDNMISSLANTAGALPLLQFCAEQLWNRRDIKARVLTAQSYHDIGGIEGALAQHAEGLVRELPSDSQKWLRSVLSRLVTNEGTRAIVERAELEQLGPVQQIRALIDRLVNERLLSVDSTDESARVELIHESLISHWPSLKRWREDSNEDSAFLHELRPMAKQWESKGKPVGLLWSGDSLLEARAFLRRNEAALTASEQDFLDAAIRLDNRAKSRRRSMIIGAFVVLGGMVAAAVVALAMINHEQKNAAAQRDNAQREATRAQAAEVDAQQKVAALEKAENDRKAADAKRVQAEAAAIDAAKLADQANAQTQAAKENLESAKTASKEELDAKNQQLQAALREAVAAKGKADEAAKRAESARAELAVKLAAEKKRSDELEAKMKANKLVKAGDIN
jgi:eukaryotic-like serine/threonine-protein kinase